jgi:hypothetical protein
MLKRTLRRYKRNCTMKKMGGMMASAGRGSAGRGSAGRGRGSAGRGRGSAGRGSAGESVNAPSPLKRSLSCSHLIYNSLHNDEDKKEYLKDIFNRDVMIKLALRILTKNMTDDIIFDIDDTDNGIYLSWLRGGIALVTVSIHTGKYDERSTEKTVRTCVKKGNSHIFFNKLNVVPKQIKFTADDEVFITSVKLTNSEEANTIITKIIEILRHYVNVQME